MKYIVTEDQLRRYRKGTVELASSIVKFLNQIISKSTRKITPKSRFYGNLREDWCFNGKEIISAFYYFKNGKFDKCNLHFSEELLEKIKSFYSVKSSFATYVIEEWYEDVMIPKFEEISGEKGLDIDEISVGKNHECVPEPVKPEGITDQEMIDYIVDNTAYLMKDVIKILETGERDLEDFYLDIVDTVARKKIMGY